VPPIGREEFGDALDGLDPEALARFVVDIYRARGATVERSGRRLWVSEGERTRELVVVDGESGKNATVAVDDRGDPNDVIDVATLHRLLLYGVDRTTCAALVKRHLGRPLDSFAGEMGRPQSVEPTLRAPERTAEHRTVGPGGSDARSRVDGAGNDDSNPADGENDGPSTGGSGRPRRPSVRRLVAAVVLAVVLAAGLAGALVVGVPGTDVDGTPGSVSERRPSEPPDPTEADADSALERATLVDGTLENGLEPVSSGPRPEALPPGVNAPGDIDEVTLAKRTVAYLSNRSYRLTLVVRESVDGRPNAFSRETVRVENATTHTVSTIDAGRFVTVPPELTPEGSYTNVRVRDGPSGPVPGGPYARAVDRYLRWYLSVSRSVVANVTTADESGTVWLVLDGDPHPGVVNTTGSVLVDERGVVREVRRAYEAPDKRGVTVRVTLRIETVERLGSTVGADQTESDQAS
jgi:hypothetical protein